MHLSLVPSTRVAPALEPVTIGQFNTWNWFDTVDDPHKSDTVYTPDQYQASPSRVVGSGTASSGSRAGSCVKR